MGNIASPTRTARQRSFLAPTRERKPDRRTQAQDARDELESHRLEALRFVDAAWPLLTRLEIVGRECGPVTYQTVMRLEAMLAQYERRHLDPEPEPIEATA